jgi:hypothetical protein
MQNNFRLVKSIFVSFLLYFSPCLYFFLSRFLSVFLYVYFVSIFYFSCHFLFHLFLPGIFSTSVRSPSIPFGLQARAANSLLTGLSFQIPGYTPKSSERQDTCYCIQRNGRSRSGTHCFGSLLDVVWLCSFQAETSAS